MTGAARGTDADVVVVGLGGLGSAAAWQLARRGRQVVGLEQFELGHARGASHGDSRIIRLSYHTPAYVRAAREAYADWADLEADAGQALLTPCGGVDVFPAGAAIPAADYLESMSAEGVPFEVVDGVTAGRRWPGLALPGDAVVLAQDATGIAPAAVGTRVMQQRALAHGAVLRDRCPVAELAADGGGVVVTCADGGTVRARAAVVTCDAWTNQVLAGLGAGLPLTVTKEHVIHFAVDPAQVATHSAPGFPVWIWMDDPSYYGFPVYGEDTVKVGQDCGGRRIDATGDEVGPHAAPDDGYVQRMTAFVHALVPGSGEVRRVTTCRYTLTPDRDFVASAVPGHPNVVVGLGAAHGFKFAPWFGRVLADLATTGRTTSDVTPFGLDRPALTDPDAPVHWLV